MISTRMTCSPGRSTRTAARARRRSPVAEALRLGTLDARLFFHAGMIHRALGEHDRAREALSRALALNPRFHLLHAQVATSVLAELQARR